MRIAMVLANGSSRRWRKDHRYPKQLAEINGEPLILRTIRQLGLLNFNDIFVVTRDTQIIQAVNKEAKVWEPEGDTRWLTQTIMSTKSAWSDENFLPFGDVCWEDSVIKDIVDGMRDEFHAYGNARLGETFGFSFGPMDFIKFEWALKHVTDEAVKSHCYGWMGTATYRTYAGLPLGEWGKTDDRGIWVDIPGWTKDIDDSDNYRKMLLAMKGEHIW
jgi:hypothetical protein